MGSQVPTQIHKNLFLKISASLVEGTLIWQKICKWAFQIVGQIAGIFTFQKCPVLIFFFYF
jgi:hypothetical protein